MSAKTPSLFDDFFFEEEKNEDLFPDIPHVYDPQENKENESKEQEPFLQDIDESEGRLCENIDDLEIEKKKKADETVVEKLAQNATDPNFKKIKRPLLELPEDTELDQQLLNEIISSDYASYIHRDYPFNPLEIELVPSPKNKMEDNFIEDQEQQIQVGQEDIIEELTFEKKENGGNPEKEDSEESTNIPLPEWDLTKKYYPIGEVAKLFDVNISHIRFWTNEFKLNPRTTRKGDRLYAPELINELKLIHYLVKVKKHTIKGAREKMKNQKETVGNNLKLKESLTELRDLLLNIQNSL